VHLMHVCVVCVCVGGGGEYIWDAYDACVLCVCVDMCVAGGGEWGHMICVCCVCMSV